MGTRKVVTQLTGNGASDVSKNCQMIVENFKSAGFGFQVFFRILQLISSSPSELFSCGRI